MTRPLVQKEEAFAFHQQPYINSCPPLRARKVVRIHLADRRYSTLTKLGLGALTFNSALAVYNSWGDASSVGFVLLADTALGLLFLCLCLRDFEQTGRGRDTKTKAAV